MNQQISRRIRKLTKLHQYQDKKKKSVNRQNSDRIEDWFYVYEEKPSNRKPYTLNPSIDRNNLQIANCRPQSIQSSRHESIYVRYLKTLIAKLNG